MAAPKHVYAPHGAALDLLHCRESEVLLSGPAGTGKSRACLEKLHLLMLANPGARGLMIRKTLESLKSTGLVTYREHVATEAIANGDVQWYGGSAEEPPQYRYRNGSKIMIGGMDKAIKIMSSEYDTVYVQEAIELTEDDWESITTRLRNGKISFQQIIADTNPSYPQHWLKRRADAGRTVLMESRHEDNPVLYAGGILTLAGASYIGKLDALTGVRYARLRKGLWVAAEGLVYEDFDPAIHLHPQIVLPPKSWTRWWSVDFGFTNPTVIQFWAQDPDGRLYLYREIYRTKTLVEDHVRAAVLAMKTHNGMDDWPQGIITDHDAEDRATMERHLGHSTVAANKTVSEGIQAVQSRLKVQPDGKPRLYLCRDAVVSRDPLLVDAAKPASTIEEITGYTWDTSGNKALKEAPLKINDHGCDAMRYVVAQVDLGARPRYRSFTY